MASQSSQSSEPVDIEDFCNCMVPAMEGAGQHSIGCAIFKRAAIEAGGEPIEERWRCNVMGGDGSIPGPVCLLPAGHFGEHYGH